MTERDATLDTRKVIYDIHLTFVYPPILMRDFDWQATRSNYEPGEPMGRGRTPVIALADLLEQEAEADDYCACGKSLASEKEQRDGVCRMCL